VVVTVVDVKWEMVGQETLAHMVMHMFEIEVVQMMFVVIEVKSQKCCQCNCNTNQ